MTKSQFSRFRFNDLSEFLEELSCYGMSLPVCRDLSILATPAKFGRLTVPNRLAVQPMEGCDCTAAGEPGELTRRRYLRFAEGGAGLLWWEACAVVPEGRANPNQMWLHAGSLASLRQLLAEAKSAARQANGYEPVNILQLTHSGRYSRPMDLPAPVIAHHSAVLDGRANLPADYPLISDEQLDRLQDTFVSAAMLAAEAGFDGVDIKSCHGYLLSELLACHTRAASRYGGSFENRTRMICETTEKVRSAVGGKIEVTTRINAFDAIEYPFGWGVDRHDKMKPDLAEPLELFRRLGAAGMGGIDITIGNPYFNPYVNRPADRIIAGSPPPPEGPLAGLHRIVSVVKQVQQALPQLTIVGSGYSWLRHLFPFVAAGLVEQGWTTLAGLGRGALAYPDFARDILRDGQMDARKCCVTCSLCTQLMRDHKTSGCATRDRQFYKI